MKSESLLNEGQRFDRAVSRVKRLIIVTTVVGVVVGFLGVLISLRLDAPWRTPFMVGVGVLIAVVTVGLAAWAARDPVGGYSAGFITSRADFFQRQRSLTLLGFSLLAVVFTPGLWRATGEIVNGEAGPLAYFNLSAWLVMALAHLIYVLGWHRLKTLRAVYNDEFSRHLRNRALLTGFATLFCGGLAVFVVGVNEPVLAIRAVPFILVLAVVTMMVSFAIMDLRAGASEERNAQ